MAKKKNENTTSTGFEEVIWRAADKLEKGPCWKFGLKTERSALFPRATA